MDNHVQQQMEHAYNRHKEMARIWWQGIIFSWEWWLGCFLMVAPWLLWLMVRKKESADRLLYAGFFVIIISILLDIIGVALGLWHYHWEVIPLIPAHQPWNMSLLPVVTVMLFIQYNPSLATIFSKYWQRFETPYYKSVVPNFCGNLEKTILL